MNRGAADCVFVNANFVTLDKMRPSARVLAVRGGKILGLFQNIAEAQRLCGPQTQTKDLGGKTVIPGIVDSHNHIIAAGVAMKGVLVFDAKNMDDLKTLVSDAAERLGPGEWIEGGGWIESQFAERRAPSRWDLDEAAPHNPVILHRLFGAAVCNSLALKLAGIDETTADPARGSIDRDPKTGIPTGVLRNYAQSLVTSCRPSVPERDRVQTLKELALTSLNEYLRWGITSVIDPGAAPLHIRAYQELYREGNLPLRINAMPTWWGLQPASEPDHSGKVAAIGAKTGFGNEWLSFGALKMAIDGGLGSKTALMYERWLDGSRSEIPLRLHYQKLEEYFAEAQSAGWSVGIHCIGDKAQDLACAAFESVVTKLPRDDVRHNIIHGYFPSSDALDTMRRHGIAVSMQPGFIWVEGDIYYDVLPEKRLEDYKPIKTYLESGITVACNSDMTSAHYNPFLGMCAAVTRRTIGGRVIGREQRLTAQEMLPLFTIEGAKLSFEENIKGSLLPGKLADFAVLSDDILSIDPDEIKNLSVLSTYIGGKQVYTAQSEQA